MNQITNIMAGTKENPRQKMIGMMYLVLTALLALNVQREILDAFVTLNTGIEQTNNENQNRMHTLYSDFKFAYNLDPEKTSSYWNSSSEIKEISQDMSVWIDSLQCEIIRKTEKISFETADTITLSSIEQLESYDESTAILIGPIEDGSKGKAFEMKQKLIKIEEKINNILASHDLEKVKLSEDFSGQDIEGELINWENRTFYDTPIAAVVAILNKIKGDIVNLEYSAVSKLFAQLDGEDIPIDTIVARVIPNKKFIMLGDTYESEVFLGAYSTTMQPIMEIETASNEYNALEVLDGVGKYSIKPTRAGVYQYNGQIKVTNKQGIEKNYPFSQEFVAVPPTAVVSPTAMNILYKGLKNPLSISVPGIEDENVIATITGGNNLSKIEPGKYETKLNNNTSSIVKLKVSADLGNGNIQHMGTMEFRVKNLPIPYVRIGKITNSGLMKKENLKAARGIIPQYEPDFGFDLPLNVTSFTMRTKGRDGAISEKKSINNKFTDDMMKILEISRSGDYINFEKIIVKGEDGKKHEVNNITIKIKR